jgi:adhesin HecA-like repeat protein
MTSSNLLATFLLFSPLATAAILHVGPGETFTAIQPALDAAAPGDTIEVAPGLYPENLVISKSPLTLNGAMAATDARGRVPGAPDPVLESIISPAVGNALVLASADGKISIQGFSIGSAAGVNGAVISNTTDLIALGFSNNRVEVTTGSAGCALRLGMSCDDATLSGNVLIAAASSPAAALLEGNASFDGLHFVDNQVLRDGPVQHSGLLLAGDSQEVAPSVQRAPLIRGNRFEGHSIGFDSGTRTLKGAEISANIFQGNLTGLHGGPIDCLISDNLWSANSTCGLRLTSGGITGDASYGARGTTVEGNVFENNGSSSDPAGHGDVVTDDQTDGTQQSNVIRRNRFGSSVALFNNEPALTLDATRNFWNAADGPSGLAPGSGGSVLGVGNIIYQPFCADADFKQMVFGSVPLTGILALAGDESITGQALTLAPASQLDLAPGAVVRVDALDLQSGAIVNAGRGDIHAGKLTLAPGAVLDISGGSLSLDPLGSGDFHIIAGSFTFFDSLGSLNINADTTFSGSTLGLASDIHVAPGVVISVLGSLVLDGCVLDGTAAYTMTVDAAATLALVRCDVTACQFQLETGNVGIRDNRFMDSTLTVAASVSGAEIFHNVLLAPSALNILPGASVTTSVEGWGNVASESAVENALSLSFRAPADPTRTLDSAGNLFVQPGDLLDVGLDISKLNLRAQAVESLLGYSTDYLAFDSLVPIADWNSNLYEVSDASGTIGRFNTAIGLDFSFPDPDGTIADGTVTDIRLLAKPLEGRTRFFFRMKSPADDPLPDTRITGSAGGVPVLKELPFTQATAVLTVDGTAPVFATGATAVQMRASVPVDVLQSGNLTAQGDVTVTFDVADELAGMDDADVSATLTGPATLTGILTSTSQVVLSGVPHIRYIFGFSVTATTPNGLYNLDAAAMDRSGNAAAQAIGTLEINKNRIIATVRPQSLVSTTLTRNVVFTATDSGGAILTTWTQPVIFTGGIGTADLDLVPVTTASLSAKMAWNRRVRLSATLNGDGQGAVSFTGTSQLPGGDFNGDNIINGSDYIILRTVFPGINPAAEITGDGVTNGTDFTVMRSNWLTAGDPP